MLFTSLYIYIQPYPGTIMTIWQSCLTAVINIELVFHNYCSNRRAVLNHLASSLTRCEYGRQHLKYTQAASLIRPGKLLHDLAENRLEDPDCEIDNRAYIGPLPALHAAIRLLNRVEAV